MSGVLVMGAGSVGCYLGGLLMLAGVPVHFVGRPRVLQALRAHGLRLTDRDGMDRSLPADLLKLHETPPAGLRPDLTLLCVKSGATEEAAALLASSLAASSLVVSMQNGLGNVLAASRLAPALDVRAGMVPFNIAELSPGHYHRGTDGDLAVQGTPSDTSLAALQTAFARVSMALQMHADLRPVQWAKLLLNLNNPVNALSGLPLRAQLLDRGYRCCLAALQSEALGLMEVAHLPIARLTPLSPRALIRLLRLPTPLFRLAAARMLRIDEAARSSMADDLANERTTEIDALCGEVLRLAQTQKQQAPLNARMVGLITAWPKRRRPYTSTELLRALGLH